MVSVATGLRGISVGRQTLSGLFDLELDQDTPVLQTKSHFRVKTCRFIYLRERKQLSRYGAW